MAISTTQLSSLSPPGLIRYCFMFAIGVGFNLVHHERGRSHL